MGFKVHKWRYLSTIHALFAATRLADIPSPLSEFNSMVLQGGWGGGPWIHLQLRNAVYLLWFTFFRSLDLVDAIDI